jgi:hypothetical protein
VGEDIVETLEVVPRQWKPEVQALRSRPLPILQKCRQSPSAHQNVSTRIPWVEAGLLSALAAILG